ALERSRRLISDVSAGSLDGLRDIPEFVIRYRLVTRADDAERRAGVVPSDRLMRVDGDVLHRRHPVDDPRLGDVEGSSQRLPGVRERLRLLAGRVLGEDDA